VPRADGRAPDQLRPITLARDFLVHPEGSVLVEFGATKVICTATVEDKVPPFLKGQGLGWITAEYGMLPRSTNTRMGRENRGPSGRSQEIQRLVGRALRAIADRGKMGERTVWIDCDVIQADGGTRTAAITGGWVALHDCLAWMRARNIIVSEPLRDHVAAISYGICNGVAVLDLDYAEDSEADTDANFVMTGAGHLVEVQGTAERTPFTEAQLMDLLALARKGIAKLVDLQKMAVM
jgi:ribonuclease PH